MPPPHLVLLPLASPPSDVDEGSAADAALSARLRSGDRQALREVYELHARPIHGVLVRLLGRTGEAEEVLQETFVVAFRKAAQLREVGSLRAWLMRIAVRQAYGRLARRKRWFSFSRSSSAGDPPVGLAEWARPGVSAEVRAELALLERELAKLPAAERCAWTLRYVEGESLEEVAAACGCSLATAKRRIAAAHQAITRYVHLKELDDG